MAKAKKIAKKAVASKPGPKPKLDVRKLAAELAIAGMRNGMSEEPADVFARYCFDVAVAIADMKPAEVRAALREDC